MFDAQELEQEIATLYGSLGHRRYDLEEISQLQHALQTADRAESGGAAPALVLAALLHDVGHMVGGFGENPAALGIDGRHEAAGGNWLAARLPASVSEPVRLHVAAKRYLCGTEPEYESTLAPDSIISLKLQGGPMGATEAVAFRDTPFAMDAVALRRLDDLAKDPHAKPPSIDHFLRHIPAAHIGTAERQSFARDGFLVLRDFFSASDVAAIDGWSRAMGWEATATLARAIQDGVSPSVLARDGGLIVVPEAVDPEQVCRFEYLLGAMPELRAMVMARIAPVISALAGEAFIPFKDKENEKHSGGGAFGPHQDFAAYQAFGPRYNITAMLPIDPATRANGCLEFAVDWARAARGMAGAVREEIDGRALLAFNEGGPSHGDVRQETIANFHWQIVETSPTDLVLFDSFVPHRSAPNGTQSSRRAMFLTFNAAREGDWYERYYADKRANYDDPKFHVSTPTARR
ncbi:MAG TPA: phytanoyl-CoA dioxygenase family protein [Rhizomicrobium sp.]|nr:phytanoyl-CoA dioxygenase family protein [Rhizomicrobium sp.]